MRIASYLQHNPLIQEFADWFIEETGREDFFLGAYTCGELFIQIEGVEIPYRTALFWRSKMREPKQLKMDF
jgi:hypothetical protein